MNKNDTLVFHLDEHTDIPELDTQTANQLLDNVFAACDVEPSVVPVEVLESWGNYKKHGFNLGRTLAYIFLILLILLPLMFFRPSIIAAAINRMNTIVCRYSNPSGTRMNL